MKYTLSAFADEASTAFSGQINALKKNGIGYIEIRNVDGRNIADLSIKEVKEVKKQLDDAGIGVWSIGSRLGKIGILDNFAPHLDEEKHTLELANTLGCDKIRMFSFYMPKNEAPESYSVYRNEVFERLASLADTAKPYGVTLCHENEKGIYGDNTERSLDIARTFPSIPLVFDCANFVQCSVKPIDAWKVLKPYVKYMHIKDALPDGRVVPAGHGAGNLKEVVSDYLASVGEVMTLEPHLALFDGLASLEARAISVEEFPFQYPTNEAAFDAAVTELKKLITNI